jgi:uncharacterized protein (TIGR03086 family)
MTPTPTDDELVRLHRLALDSTRAFVAGIPDDAWGEPTPCAEWNVRQLVDHVVAGNLWAGELACGATIDEVGDRFDGGVLGSDPLAAYDESAEAAARAFGAAGAIQAPCAVSYGPVPGSVYCGHRTADVSIHKWDIALATGQSATLDPQLVSACLAILEPQAEMLVASGMFAGDVPAPDDADELTRLLALVGRRA